MPASFIQRMPRGGDSHLAADTMLEARVRPRRHISILVLFELHVAEIHVGAEHARMRSLLLLAALVSSLCLSASADVRGDACGHHDAMAYMPSQCPFVNVNTGFRCMGLPMSDGLSLAGNKYKCSNGHQWVVSR